jgi:predicted RNA polymerase sigma factor
VLKTLYLLFNEGYNSSHPEKLIREDLCEEAIRLCLLLTENPKTNLPQANALLALMCFHISRFEARLDDKGFIVLLKDQDRKQWNKFLIDKGNQYMQLSAEGGAIHEFHIEAAIASVHANAAAYEETNWQMILQLYDSLLQRTENPIVALNRCVAIGEIDGPEQAIEELLQLKGFDANCYYNTTLAEMYLRANRKTEARKLFEKALMLTASHAESELIIRKIRSCN